MEPRQFLNYTVAAVIGVKQTEGNKYGIELELEGRNVGLADVATRGWQRHKDNSLRGEAIEYITAGAKGLDESKKLLTELFSKFKEHKVKFNDSIRTSTHVHLNFSDKPIKHVVNFFTLFTLFEEVLQYYSGEDRKGNLFCISTREGEGVMGILADSIAKGDLSRFAGDKFKYAACNLSTLYKFGTVEVRTMRGATSAEQINAWLDILNDMYVYACNTMKSPAELVSDLSHLGADGLMRKVFSEANVKELMLSFPKPLTLHYSLMEGARILQVFAYNFEEEFLAVVEVPKMGERRILAKRIPHGDWEGNMYAVYRPDGRQWNCDNHRGGALWVDGEACGDDRQIRWSAQRGRFIYVNPVTGVITPLNWKRHEEFGDEGPPLRGQRVEEEPMEEEPDWDEDEEMD